MDSIIQDNIDPADLKKFETLYSEQFHRGRVAEKTQFDYGWCLIRSRYQNDMKKGIAMLDDLLQNEKDDISKRDYLYYIAVGHTRLKEYEKALRYIDAVSKIEPGNHQAKQLHDYIKKKMEKDGLTGMAIVGGAAVVLGGLITLGVAALKK